MAGPTPFADLNGVLADLVAGASDVLGGNFCGAYLVGSFAIGDADAHSDVDFLIVTHGRIGGRQERGLRLMHAVFPDRSAEWARHLEGSYVYRAALRRLDPAFTPWLYVDNGSREMEWSAHDNNAVMRWSLREHGVVLAGPLPTELVEPVAPADLRGEARTKLAECVSDLLTWSPRGLDGAWAQPYVVSSVCRMLYTLEHDVVTSKRSALLWAVDALDARWSDLIRGALADRPDPWTRVFQPARPGSVEATMRFVDYAVSRAGRLDTGQEPGGSGCSA